MIPFLSIRRIRWLFASEKYTFPAESNAMPAGSSSFAATAGPPSPEYPQTPVPAITDSFLSGLKRTIRHPPPVGDWNMGLSDGTDARSDTYRLPLESNAM